MCSLGGVAGARQRRSALRGEKRRENEQRGVGERIGRERVCLSERKGNTFDEDTHTHSHTGRLEARRGST